MEPDDLRSFACRDWAALARSKRDFWAERYRDAGAAPARRAADALLLHARRLAATGAAGHDRAADLTGHLTLRDRLDRAARAFARR